MYGVDVIIFDKTSDVFHLFIYNMFKICRKTKHRKKLIINKYGKKKHRNKLLFNVKTSYEVFLKDFFFVIDWDSN